MPVKARYNDGNPANLCEPRRVRDPKINILENTDVRSRRPTLFTFTWIAQLRRRKKKEEKTKPERLKVIFFYRLHIPKMDVERHSRRFAENFFPDRLLREHITCEPTMCVLLFFHQNNGSLPNGCVFPNLFCSAEIQRSSSSVLVDGSNVKKKRTYSITYNLLIDFRNLLANVCNRLL